MFICEIPLITSQGFFIINGIKRIISLINILESIIKRIFSYKIFIRRLKGVCYLLFFNESVRNPGLYISKDKENFLSATIIPKFGTWTTIKLNLRLKINYWYQLILIYFFLFKNLSY